MAETEAERAGALLDAEPAPSPGHAGDVEVRPAASVAEIQAASALFDGPVRAEWAERFLAERTHHLLFAFAEGTAVGMISGVELTHPDKGTEMLLYELGVGEEHRRRGIGTALVESLLAVARERGCYGMWVGLDTDNDAALRTYAATGGDHEGEAAMVIWDIEPPLLPVR
ncbi:MULTISPECIES: GNAT family N-acetyltransferase [Streptomyces]|uniref:GNAT family N-acetyltransferase n=1 Tax=Streptomyces TaxID=1883 RepID=UPI000CD530C2|nr:MULTISPECIES: GNAT family N-acetyltransferase [Streptomyces]